MTEQTTERRISGERESGRDLEVRVAVEVMGWRWQLNAEGGRVLAPPGMEDGTGFAYGRELLPHLSIDISATWAVFTHPHLLANNWLPVIEAAASAFADTPGIVSWEVGFTHQTYDACLEYVDSPDEIPAAICRTSLAATSAPPDKRSSTTPDGA